jgi:hypothetical protein
VFFPGTPVSSNNKTDSHDTTEILLKVALNILTLTGVKHYKPNQANNSYVDEWYQFIVPVTK